MNLAPYRTPIFDLLHLIAQFAFDPFALRFVLVPTDFEHDVHFVVACAHRFLARVRTILAKILSFSSALADPSVGIPSNEIATVDVSLVLSLSDSNPEARIIDAIEFRGRYGTNKFTDRFSGWFATRFDTGCTLETRWKRKVLRVLNDLVERVNKSAPRIGIRLVLLEATTVNNNVIIIKDR